MSAAVINVMVIAGVAKIIADNSDDKGVIRDFDPIDEALVLLQDSVDSLKGEVHDCKVKQWRSEP